MEKQLIWLVLGVALALLFVSWSRDEWTRHQRRAVARRAQSGENRAKSFSLSAATPSSTPRCAVPLS